MDYLDIRLWLNLNVINILFYSSHCLNFHRRFNFLNLIFKNDKLKISQDRLKNINTLKMDLERLVKTHNNTESEYERVELVDRIKSLQEIILEEARFDISSNGNKSTNELNSKLQNEIDRLQMELAKERDENLKITKDKYSVYEKLRESELNKHKITKEYESVIKKKSEEFKTIIDLLQADLDTEKLKNKELKKRKQTISILNLNIIPGKKKLLY